MKFLIAFAVFAVAFAAEQIQVVHLPPAPAPAYEVPDVGPLIVAQSVLEALAAMHVHEHQDILRVNYVDTPIDMAYVPEPVMFYRASEAEGTYFEDVEPSIDEESMKVKVVDVPNVSFAATDAEETNIENVEPFVADESRKVNFVDAPFVAYDVSYAEESNVGNVEPIVAGEGSMKIKVVDAPIESFAATDAEEINADDSLKVRFVDAPVVFYENTEAKETNVEDVEPFVAHEDPMKIKVVDAPIESYAATDAEETNADNSLKVRFANSPAVAYEDTVAEETNVEDIQNVPEPVKVAKVNFVNAPIQAEAFDTVKVAEPVFESIPAVEPIKVAEIPRSPKMFADPRLR